MNTITIMGTQYTSTIPWALKYTLMNTITIMGTQYTSTPQSIHEYNHNHGHSIHQCTPKVYTGIQSQSWALNTPVHPKVYMNTITIMGTQYTSTPPKYT